MEVHIDEVLKHMRELIGTQAQEIAVLKATLETQPPSTNP